MQRERSLSEVLKRGYSDEELEHVYSLARFNLENGNLNKALTIARGIIAVAPEFGPAWMINAYVYLSTDQSQNALNAAREAYKVTPTSVEVILLLITALLSEGDLPAAGAYLGEVGESIERGEVENPDVIRYYRGQLARYSNEA